MSDKISRIQLQVIEKSLDKMFAKLGIDVGFSGHFLDRINDPRNEKQITISELINIYNSLYDKFGIKISKTPEEVEEVIKSISTDINIPVNIHHNRKTNNIEMAAKTIMRKKNFKTPNKVLQVESFKTYIRNQEILNEMPNPVMIRDPKVIGLNNLQTKSPEDIEKIKQSITALYIDYLPLLATVKSKFESKIRNSLKGFHGVKFLSDTKSLESIIDKTVYRKKQLSSINDLVRGAVLMQKKSDADSFVEDFLSKNQGIIAGYEEKIRGQDTMYGYFGSHHLDLNINGIIVELQVMTSKLWKYKEEAHVIYNNSRSKPGGADKFDSYKSNKIFKIANIHESLHESNGQEITLSFDVDELEDMDYESWEVVHEIL